MIAHFHAHRDEFEVMLSQVGVDADGLRELQGELGVVVDFWHPRSAPDPDVLPLEERGIYFNEWVRDSNWKGYVWRGRAPIDAVLVESLDTWRDGYYYRHIEGAWYLFHCGHAR